MSNWTQAQVESALRDFGKTRWDAVLEVCREGEPDGIGVTLIAAIGLRESWLQNIVGDGGHGRGWLQIDDRAWPAWLKSVPGLRSGTWAGHTGHSAKMAGHVPYMTRSTMKAIDILRANRAYAISQGVPSRDALRVAIAGYNCGAGNALAAYRRYGISGVDRYTTGDDYSADVLKLKGVVANAAHRFEWAVG